MAMCVVARLRFVREPTIRPNLRGAQHRPAGAEDDADGLVVVEDEGEAGHGSHVPRLLDSTLPKQTACHGLLRATCCRASFYGGGGMSACETGRYSGGFAVRR